MKWIYVAGPYTVPDPLENTHNAVKAAERLLDMGYVPIVPHITLAWHMIAPKPPEFWYAYTAELLRRCDLMLRLPGFSSGADREEALAESLGIPVFRSISEMESHDPSRPMNGR